MSALARIRANGGDVVRTEWHFRLLPGRLTSEAIAWIKGRWADVCREVWPLLDLWAERAAIMEYDGLMPRAEAERRAYEEVCAC